MVGIEQASRDGLTPQDERRTVTSLDRAPDLRGGIMNRKVRSIGLVALAVALLAGCSGSSSNAVAASSSPDSSSPAASKVDPIVGTWTRLPAQAGPLRRVLAGTLPAPTIVTLKIAADGSYTYTLNGTPHNPRVYSTTGTWKPSGGQYAWEFSDPNAEYFGFAVFPDRGTKGTWYLSAQDTLEQKPTAPATVSESYIRSPA